MVLKDSSLFPGVGIVSCGKSWQCRELEERGGGLGLTFAWRTLLMSSWRDLTRVSEYVSNFLILPSFCKHCKMDLSCVNGDPQMIKNRLNCILSHLDTKNKY